MTSSSRGLLSGRAVVLGAVMAVTCAGAVGLGASDARANDFFSNLFGAFLGHPQSSRQLSYAPDGWTDPQDVQQRPQRQASSGGGRQAFCVRTCDGRYFPVQTGNGQSSATAASRIRRCRMPSSTATKSLPAVPATARISSVLPRSMSTTIRPFAKAILSLAPTA